MVQDKRNKKNLKNLLSKTSNEKKKYNYNYVHNILISSVSRKKLIRFNDTSITNSDLLLSKSHDGTLSNKSITLNSIIKRENLKNTNNSINSDIKNMKISYSSFGKSTTSNSINRNETIMSISKNENIVSENKQEISITLKKYLFNRIQNKKPIILKENENKKYIKIKNNSNSVISIMKKSSYEDILLNKVDIINSKIRNKKMDFKSKIISNFNLFYKQNIIKNLDNIHFFSFNNLVSLDKSFVLSEEEIKINFKIFIKNFICNKLKLNEEIINIKHKKKLVMINLIK